MYSNVVERACVSCREKTELDQTFFSNSVEKKLNATSQKSKSYVSCGATVAVLVFGFCFCCLLCRVLVHTGLTAVAAGMYSERADKYSGPGSPVHS